MGDYFFCYDKNLMKHLRGEGHTYITKAINPKTRNMFALFEVSEELDASIRNFNKVASLNFG